MGKFDMKVQLALRIDVLARYVRYFCVYIYHVYVAKAQTAQNLIKSNGWSIYWVDISVTF